ncbi:MAG: phospholipase [Bacteroidetes bacterium]|nr:phospholipase [Bacteroidota bacterium]
MAFGEYSHVNDVKLVRSGAEYFSLLKKLIDEAKDTIHLQVYILENDVTGDEIAHALIQAAARGVKVYVIIDGYASKKWPEEIRNLFSKTGVHFRRFEPLLANRYFYFGRRLHHKVFVADACKALVGGINIGDRYNDMPEQKAWFDVALYVDGETAIELEQVCVQLWNNWYGSQTKAELTPFETCNRRISGVEPGVSVRVRRNDWVKIKNEVWKSYFNMFNHADEYIIIVCSYFMPGWKYRQAMSKAVKRGVKIRVVLAGRSDVMLSKYAERYLYRWMFKNNVAIYEYYQNVLHAKMAVQDDKWVTIGSYNVNEISASASIELNLDVRNRPFAKTVRGLAETIIMNDCKEVTQETYNTFSSAFRWVLHLCAYYIVKFMLFAVTFYYKKERD